MELGQLQAFVQVAQLGSFRRAAEVLFLSQPTVSARIQALEHALGEVLFERTTRSVRLTEAGRLFLEHAQRSIHALDEGKVRLAELRKSTAGILRVGAARAVGTYVLPKMLARFGQRFPEVEVFIRTGRSADVVTMVLNNEVQLGLGRFMQHPELTSAHLYNEEIVLVTEPNHPFTRAERVTLTDVAREPLILYDPGSFYYNAITSACQQAGIVPNVAMQLDSIEATKKMVELGLGISFLQRSAFEREQQAGLLAHVPIAGGFDVHLPTTIFYRKGARLPGPPRAFLDVLNEMFKWPQAGANSNQARATPRSPRNGEIPARA
jgi:DNA-binding transcriptional LysR family regulator